ncbi:Iron(III) dicitrate transport protein FecA [Helicobacter sp. NHP19-012]|uniref:Iron(III) dicitrate transport protein FecA n=2 Tax=Helicobacter gastrofelis TaxID=2849642 RepID=A0ABN6I6X5_9HELI|nr:TonB-dependent receptor family protein [Helicobacter sp. NHP19-012]BCZ19295.1 Iron(III) dicitrate transport protein FecA [Helicobacter sp. NHP19-012]
MHKRLLSALIASLACQVALDAKDKTYTLGKVSTAGQRGKTDYSGHVNLGYSGITAPKSWQDEEVKKYTGSRTVISHKALSQQANQSIEEALQNVPGLQVRNATGVGAMPSIQIRGFGAGGSGHSDATLMLVNGIPVYMAPYSHIELDIFPVTFQAIDRIDVIKGGGSVQYGPNTYGGIVNIITKPIPKHWENQVAERTTFWAKARNAGFAAPPGKTGNPSFLKSLGNDILYNTYVRSGGMINKHVGVQAQANWVDGQGFRDNSPTNIQNYWLDGVYDINEKNGIKAYYQYYKFNIAQPGSLSAEQYQENRFANMRPLNSKGGRSQRFGIVYENRFGDLEKIGGTFSFTYYGQFMTRDFQVSSSYNSANMVTCFSAASCAAQGLSGYNLAVPYYATNYNGWGEVENPVRSINNAFEPKVNLVVNTGKVKQTFIMGLRYMTTTFLQRQYMNTNECATKTSGEGAGFLCEGANVMSGWQPHIKHGLYKNWNNWRNDYTAVYLSDRIETWNGRFFVVPGLRYALVQYNNENAANWASIPKKDLEKIKNMNNWMPSTNIGFIPIQGDHTLLTYFNYQRSYVPPQLDVLSYGGAEYFTQHFDTVEVGARYTYKSKVSFNADFFRIWARDFATGQYSIYTSGPMKGNVRPVNGYSQGVELEAYYRPIQGLQLHAAFNYIDTRVTSHEQLTDLNGGVLPGTSYNKHFPFVSPYQFILDARYTYKKTTFGLSSYFYSRAYSGISNSAAGGYYGTQRYTNSGPNANGGQCAAWCMTQHEGMLPWYWVWNIQVSQVFWESGRHKIVGSLQVNNIFNMKYYFTGIGSSPAGLQPGPGRSVTAYLSYTF